jgi:predicted esterase
MKIKTTFKLAVVLCLLFAFGAVLIAVAQEAPPKPKGGGQFPIDPRVQMRSYLFKDGDISENLEYAVYVSTKVSKDKASPLIVTLHGLGAPSQIMFGAKALELAEAGGYILVGPMGYNVRGWYGIPNTPTTGMAPKTGMGPGQPGAKPAGKPAIPGEPGQPGAKTAPKAANPGEPGAKPAAKSKMPMGSLFGDANDPANLRELSEKDVMNVLDMVRKEFNIDDNRIYLMGHSMGGAGTLHLGVKYSSIWAALGPIAPAAFQLNPDSLKEISKMPIIFVHGDADEMVPVANTRQWIEKAKELGMTYEYNEMPGVTHGPVIEDALPSVYAFFAKHSKTSSR